MWPIVLGALRGWFVRSLFRRRSKEILAPALETSKTADMEKR
jgi:hypothetical protein